MPFSVASRRFAFISTRTILNHPRLFQASVINRKQQFDMSLNSNTISDITQKEKDLIGQDAPVKGGAAAAAMSNANQPLTGQVVSDITRGEQNTHGGGGPIAGGAAATAQSMATKVRCLWPIRLLSAVANGLKASSNATSTNGTSGSTVFDSNTISKVTQAEREITGEPTQVRGGPGAAAQSHVGKFITSEAIRDITEGEKSVTGEARPVKGGPTAAVQSELTKGRQ